MRGIHPAGEPLAWWANVVPHAAAHTRTGAATAARHHHAARSRASPATQNTPAASTSVDTWVNTPTSNAPPTSAAAPGERRASHRSVPIATTTPTSSISAYMRASRP